MTDIKIPILSDKKDVKKFLDDLKAIINNVSFDSNDDLIIIKSSKDEVQYSTRYTLFDLDYDTVDVVDRLKELTVSDYSETLIDKDDDKNLIFYGNTGLGKTFMSS